MWYGVGIDSHSLKTFFSLYCFQLLDAYFSRALKEQKEKFLKNHGFSLLANQLYIHQGSQGLLECFLEMLFGRPMGLEEEWVNREPLSMILPPPCFCLSLKASPLLLQTHFFLLSNTSIIVLSNQDCFLQKMVVLIVTMEAPIDFFHFRYWYCYLRFSIGQYGEKVLKWLKTIFFLNTNINVLNYKFIW